MRWVPLLLAVGVVVACNGSMGGAGDAGGGMYGDGDPGETADPEDYGLDGNECTFHGDCESSAVCDDGYCVESVPVEFCATTPALAHTALPDAMDADVGVLLSADLDGDGIEDLLSSRAPATKGVQVLLGPGDGVPINVSAGGGTLAPLQLGHFDGDAHLDLLAHVGEESLSVFPGDGVGSFGDPISTQMGGASEARLAHDVDGDGLDDVAGAAGSNAQLWLGDGAGGFSWHSSQPGYEEDLALVVLGDVAGGPEAELIHIDPLARVRAVDVAGDGEHILEPVGTGPFENHELHVGHVGADPRPDLMRSYARNGTATTLTLWLRTDTGLTPPRHFVLPAELNPQDAGDIDGVGGPDLVLTGGNTLYIVFNVASEDNRCLAEYDSDHEWVTATVSDFDGDDRDEVIWSDQTEFVLSQLE